MRRASYWASWLVISAAFSGCGGKSTQAPPAGAAEVEVKPGAPGAAPATRVEALEMDGRVGVLGGSSSSHVLAAVGGEIYEVDAGKLVHRALYAEGDDPTALGAVYAIAPRLAGGAWIAAEKGVFLLDTMFVTKASFGTGSGAVRSASEVGAGPLQGLWVAGDDGLFRRRGSDLTKYSVANADGAITAIAVDAAGSCALAISGGEAILIEASSDETTSDVPPLDAGTINAVAAGTGALYAASDKGILRYRPSATPKWTRFTLAAEGQPEAKVLSVAVDATGLVWMRTETQIVRLAGDDLSALDGAAITASSLTAIAVDEIGDVWAADAMKLDHIGTGGGTTAVTFSADLSPWLGMYCTKCHGNQTQNFQDYDVFLPLAEKALERVRAGDMPRCDGGVPCPSDQHLNASQYSVLEQWIRAGKPK
jgi:hypothetical protein